MANLIDRIFGYFSPLRGAKREYARYQLGQLREKLDSVRANPAKNNRLTRMFGRGASSGDNPNMADVAEIRNRAWELFEENPHARKVVRMLAAQVFGCGLMPKSDAKKADRPYKEFRAAAKKLWRRWTLRWDYEGDPKSGGLGYVGFTEQIAREVVVGGEVFLIERHLSRKEMKARRLPIPLAIEMLGAEWLADDVIPGVPKATQSGNWIWRGIEYDSTNRRVAYHFRTMHPEDPRWMNNKYETIRVPAEYVRHVYMRSRPKQQRGESWFKAAILRLKNIDDYDYNELMAAATSAMLVFVSNTEFPVDNLSQLQSNTPDEDGSGNRVEKVQGLTHVHLSTQEKFSGFNQARPNPNAAGFGEYQLRSIATSFPGIKGSTLHGDYKGASFSSERAADNDCWRETESLQAWFAETLFQPLWELMLETGVMEGWFTEELDGRGFSGSYFFANRDDLEPASWHGPVARTMEPKKEAEGVKQELELGVTTWAQAVAQYGGDPEQNLSAIEELFHQIDEMDIDDGIKTALMNQILGVAQKPPDVFAQALIDKGLAPSPEETMEHETEMNEANNASKEKLGTQKANGQQAAKGGKQSAA